jgi:hypothetical protein
MLPIAACNISQQANNFIDDKISREQTGGRVSVRPVRLDLQRGRHPFIDQAFGRSHLSGCQIVMNEWRGTLAPIYKLKSRSTYGLK